MDLATQEMRCPGCGAHLAGGEQDTYHCAFCGSATSRAALVQPQRTPYTGGFDRLWHAVGADFDQDGWFEICGWHKHALHAIDLVDRTLMWTTLEGSENDHDLYAGPGRVYVATDADLTAINAYTGARVWSAALMNTREVHDPGYVANGSIWVRTAQDKLFGVDRATGAIRATFSGYDSASLFRTICGQRLVMLDADGLRLLDATQDRPVLEIGVGALKALDDMVAGRTPSTQPVQINGAVVHRGVLYVAVASLDGRATYTLDAYRIPDNRLVARRTVKHEVQSLAAAVAGRPVSQNDNTLRLEPDGPTWSAGGDNPEIKMAKGVGRVLVVHVTSDGPGSDRHTLVGLDATSFTPVWQLDHIGYLMSEIVCTDERIVFAISLGGSHKFVAIDPASGATLWETTMPSETGLQVGGGLVVQTRMGATVLAESGEMMFPTDQRKSTPAGPPIANAPEELPDWGIEGGATSGRAGAATGGSKAALWIALVILAIVGTVVAFVMKR
jgi:outer membrane protein assembly factor BamB